MIKFTCPTCGKVISVRDEHAGRKGKCSCGAVVIAPSPKANAPVIPPAPGSPPFKIRSLQAALSLPSTGYSDVVAFVQKNASSLGCSGADTVTTCWSSYSSSAARKGLGCLAAGGVVVALSMIVALFAVLLRGSGGSGAGGAVMGIVGSVLPVIVTVGGIVGAIWAYMKVAVRMKVEGLPELEFDGLIHLDGQRLCLFPLTSPKTQMPANDPQSVQPAAGLTLDRCIEIDLARAQPRVTEFFLPGKIMRKYQNPGAFDLNISLLPDAPPLRLAIGTANNDTPPEVLRAFRVGESI